MSDPVFVPVTVSPETVGVSRPPPSHHQRHGEPPACRTAFQGTPRACGEILLVGELNPISQSPEFALFCAPDGCSGQRLQDKIFGLPRAEYLAMWRTNLCVQAWSATRARERARVLLAPDVPWRTIVLLGAKVSGAFGQVLALPCGQEIRPFTTHRLPSTQVLGLLPRLAEIESKIICLPHPSGLNRIWNTPGAVGTARQIMREVAPDLAWGTV